MDHLRTAESAVRALGWDGIAMTRRLDGAWVAAVVKGSVYGATLPSAIGSTPDEALDRLVQDPRIRP